MSIMERLTALFAPDDCLGCGREGSLLCSACLPTLPALTGRCFGCHKSIVGAGCADCIAASALNELIVTASYEGVAKLLVACLKFRSNQGAASVIGDCMAAQTPLPSRAWLVNIPATTAHIRERGFDQAGLIARQLSRRSSLPYVGVLRRVGQQHQFGAGRQQRLEQLSASVSVRNTAVRGRHIILVDDVLTTGSSLKVAATALRTAGASRVDALVFAQSIRTHDS